MSAGQRHAGPAPRSAACTIPQCRLPSGCAGPWNSYFTSNTSHAGGQWPPSNNIGSDHFPRSLRLSVTLTRAEENDKPGNRRRRRRRTPRDIKEAKVPTPGQARRLAATVLQPGPTRPASCSDNHQTPRTSRMPFFISIHAACASSTTGA